MRITALAQAVGAALPGFAQASEVGVSRLIPVETITCAARSVANAATSATKARGSAPALKVPFRYRQGAFFIA